MELDEYGRVAAAEDDHWWYRGIRDVARLWLRPWLASPRRILDAGCGPGGNGAWLASHGALVGVDVNREALRFVQMRWPTTAPVCGDIALLPFRDDSFDVALVVTVLYAVKDDELALRELARVVAPGGAVLVVEPAFESLRREHDATVHGLRRYRRSTLLTRVQDHGFSVRRASYAYSFLAPPAAILAGLSRLRHRRGTSASDVERRGLDVVFDPLARLERAWLAHHDVRFGTSVMVLATRP